MRRIISLFILLIYLLFLIIGSGSCTTQSNFPLMSLESTSYSRSRAPINTSHELNNYTSYDDLSIILYEIERDYKSIVKLYNNAGKTYELRTIWTVKISDNPSLNEDYETKVLFVGAHHGNELIGNEMAISIIETFTEGYGKDPRITWMVDNHEIWVIPMPNPDGSEYTLNNESWRKNRSPNYIQSETPILFPTSYGTDLNRNYDIQWDDPGESTVYQQRSPTYAGPAPFSEFETQAIRDLVLAHNFSVYIDYHSGLEAILYPWGYTGDPTPDNALYERVAEKLSKLTSYEARQGYELYQTRGSPIDWIYSVTRTMAFTIELSSLIMPDPTTIQPILDNNIKQPIYLTGISADLELGSYIEINQGILENQTTLGPFLITETIKGIPPESDLEVKIYYKLNDNEYKTMTMQNSDDQLNIYTAKIPIQKSGGVISYFISVENKDIMVTLPKGNNEFEFNIKDSNFNLNDILKSIAWLIGLFFISIIIIIIVIVVVILKKK